MLIKTTKPDLLILDTSYPAGAVVDVPDEVGKRLVQKQAAVPVAEVPVDDQVVETATAPAPPRNAAKRV